MKPTPRQFYRSLEPDQKEHLASIIGISYHRLSCGYFANDHEKRPRLDRIKLKRVHEALQTMGGYYTYAEVLSHFYPEPSSVELEK